MAEKGQQEPASKLKASGKLSKGKISIDKANLGSIKTTRAPYVTKISEAPLPKFEGGLRLQLLPYLPDFVITLTNGIRGSLFSVDMGKLKRVDWIGVSTRDLKVSAKMEQMY